jgi:CRISPR/Cas system-associated exonuclease Cas4 (RecB family)
MDDLLKIYYNRHKAVRVLIYHNKNEKRKIELKERLSEIERTVYEIKKIKNLNKNYATK